MNKNRLRWACRRGMLELDVLLLPFTEQEYLKLSEEDKTQYKRLIDCEDQDLFNWFMEKSVCPDTDIHRLINLVLAHARRG